MSTDSDWSLEDSEDEESHKRRKALMKAKWEARQRAEEAAKEQEAKRARMRTPVGRLKAKLGDVVDRAKAAKDAGQRRMRTIRRTLMGTKLKVRVLCASRGKRVCCIDPAIPAHTARQGCLENRAAQACAGRCAGGSPEGTARVPCLSSGQTTLRVWRVHPMLRLAAAA